MNTNCSLDLYAKSPNQIVSKSCPDEVYPYLGYYSDGKIYNIYCVTKNNLPTDWETLSKNFITLPKPSVSLSGTTISIFIPKPVQIALRNFNVNNNITFTARQSLSTKLTCSITEIGKSHEKNFNKTPPSCQNPYEVYYTIKTTDNLNVESHHLLIWRDSTTKKNPSNPTQSITTYFICCKSYY